MTFSTVLQLLLVIAITLHSANAQKPPQLQNNNGHDHRAHAVPGGPYYQPDTSDQTAKIHLNGHLSHSHYFNPTTGTTGRILEYIWTTTSTTSKEKVICRKVTCSLNFPRGKSKIKLTVVDNTGDSASASTKVIVYDGGRQGLRLLYYPFNPWIRYNYMNENSVPTMSQTKKQLNLYTFSNVPKQFQNHNDLSVRVLGTLRLEEGDIIKFRIKCDGDQQSKVACALHIGPRPIVKGRYGNSKKITSDSYWFSKGEHSLHILYRRTYENSSKRNYIGKENLDLVLKWKKSDMNTFKIVPQSVLCHRPMEIKPVVHFVKPLHGVRVGSVLSLRGSGFVGVKVIRVGGRVCERVFEKRGQSSKRINQYRVNCVVPGVRGLVGVFVETFAGVSNVVIIHVIEHDGNSNGNGTSINSNGNGKEKDDDERENEKKKNKTKKNTRKGNNEKDKNNDHNNNNNTSSPDVTISTNEDDMGPLGYYQQIRFRETFLKEMDGTLFQKPQLTSITLGPDFNYYIGSLTGFIQSLHVNQPYATKIISRCTSEHVGTHRSILGLAFNPAHSHFLLYASTSILYWKSKRLLDLTDGWANGEVITMRKHDKKCLVKGKIIVKGLPVSNYDHAINSILFDSQGRLLISVGCSTNAGVSLPNDPMGGVPDSPLSGSVIMINVMRHSHGYIKYNQYANPSTSAITNNFNNHISIYAYGIRNSFGMTMHSNGWIYLTDNGANPKYGNQSITCSKHIEARHEKDSLKRLKQGSFYGYANRNRGRWDREQCVHHRPSLRSDGKFDGAIINNLEASTNGIIEYTANTFGGQLRNELILSKFAVQGNGNTIRVKLDDDDKQGKNVTAVIGMKQFSGIGISMSGTGGLLMPRVYQGVVAALVPIERYPKGFSGSVVVTSVLPFRGPVKGGGTVMVTGWGLSKPLKIWFVFDDGEERECTGVHKVDGDEEEGRGVLCEVPRGKVGAKAKVVVSKGGNVSRTFGFEYMYMAV